MSPFQPNARLQQLDDLLEVSPLLVVLANLFQIVCIDDDV